MTEISVANDVQCYNRGCQKKFNPTDNNNDSCRHHPGTPVFHDALKGWSCCKKRSTDFTMFLNEPGCTYGFHSNEKQEALSLRPGIKDVKEVEKKVKVVEEIKNKPIEHIPEVLRPSNDEQKIRLDVKVLPSTQSALVSQLDILAKISLSEESEERIANGTTCKRSGCKKQYHTEDNDESCLHHPGAPVFHEGMKYWSCCQLKTSDFTRFLEQEGCKKTNSHQWKKPVEENTDDLTPRIDWFQTGTHITISLFSKLILPEFLVIETNKVQLTVSFKALQPNSSYKPGYSNTFNLFGIVDPLRCTVKLMPSKLEISLRKSGPATWKCLELP